MEYIRLGDLYKITKGKKVDALEEINNDSVRYIQIDDLRNNNNIKYCMSNGKYVFAKKEDLIIAWDGANAGTIGYGIEGAIGSTLALLRTDNKLVYTPFIGRYMQAQSKTLRDKCMGATIPHIQKSVLEDILIPKYDIKIQQKIATILDKAQSLIDKRKEQIEAYDELVKSLFYEMFGDPVINDKGWKKDIIGNNFNVKTGSTPSRKEKHYWESGIIPWVKTTELKECVIIEAEEYITQKAYENSSVTLFPEDTILIAMYGQGKTRGMTGKLAIKATSNQACAALLPNEKNNQDFIWNQLKLSYDDLRNLGRGGNQPNLNLDLVRSFEIIFPPLPLQNKFAAQVEKIEQQKKLLEKSLKELENNFNSLMQRAFKGELF